MKVFSQDSVSFVSDRSKSEIMEKLQEKRKPQKFEWRQLFDLNFISYTNFSVEGDRIKIRPLSGTRRAPIYIYLEERPGGKTTMRFEQVNSKRRWVTVMAIVTVILIGILYSINGVEGVDDPGSVLTVKLILGSIFIAGLLLMFYLTQKVEKYFFKKYAKQVVRDLGE